ncbi:MAG: TlpA family protein disulfide reductase [Lachnospiraceae bacterium]|nr:TlpA family protein disulfide reductase [Lachnospiraceae bacterium]
MGMLGGCGGKEQNEAAQTGEVVVEEADTGADSGEEAGATDETGEEAEADKAGQSAGIAFEAQDLEGNIVTEEVFADSRLTMVNVWATYCNPCLSEMPELGELAGEYATEEFQIIGIISDVQEGAELENTVYAATLVEQTGAAYPHLLLNESLFNAMLSGVSAVPTTFFVDENGEVLDTVVGAMDKDSWKEKIDGLLKE